MPPHGFVDFYSVVAILGRQSHDGLVYFGRDGRHVRERLVGPFPPLVESVFHRNAPALALGEEISPALCRLYKRVALVKFQPAKGITRSNPPNIPRAACGINRQPRAKCEPESDQPKGQLTPIGCPSFLSTKSEIAAGSSRAYRSQRLCNSRATSSETSSDQRSAVLKATTWIGLLYLAGQQVLNYRLRSVVS
jgi:hypothetical protein